MVSQFVPAPIAWALSVETQSDIPALRKPVELYPVIGWVYDPERSGGPLVTWFSYKGHPAPLDDVLEDLRSEIVAKAERLQLAARGNLSYHLAPA
jgi:hypothetical protein